MRSRVLSPVVLAIVLAGCGGGGSSFSPGGSTSPLSKTPTTETRKGIAAAFASTQQAMSFSFGGGVFGTRSVAGRKISPVPRFMLSKFKRTSRNHNGDEHADMIEVYYDDFLELWVQENLDTTDIAFFEDESLTKAAGYYRARNTGLEVEPIEDIIEYEVTAGPMAGMHGKHVRASYSFENRGTEIIDEVYADGTIMKSTAEWHYEEDDSSAFYHQVARTDSPSGAWTTYVYDQPGSADRTYTFQNSAELNWRFTFKPMFDGFGEIKGPFDGLPASLLWNDTGEGTITYQDGSQDSFTDWMLPGF